MCLYGHSVEGQCRSNSLREIVVETVCELGVAVNNMSQKGAGVGGVSSTIPSGCYFDGRCGTRKTRGHGVDVCPQRVLPGSLWSIMDLFSSLHLYRGYPSR